MRKPIALVSSENEIVVLCDDGSLWTYRYNYEERPVVKRELKWFQDVPPVPGTSAALEERQNEEVQRGW